MLIAVALILTPEADIELPAMLGRANYAATLRRLAEWDTLLAAALHDEDGLKPLTCSGVHNAPPTRSRMRFRRGERYVVRMTGLNQTVSQALQACLIESRPQTWVLEHQLFQVMDVICDSAENPWTGIANYEEMAAAVLFASSHVKSTVTLEFSSPTAFKSSAGMTVPIPLPGLVFGSLTNRWNAFSPAPLDPQMRAFSDGYIAISRYRLESKPVDHKQTGLRIGGVGKVTYRALEGDRYWLGMWQALAEFARFSGAGIQTTTGMGQTRCLADE